MADVTTWNPAQYLRFADDRTRPFIDLLARIHVAADTIADLGCGPGHLMPLLLDRWPTASITGVDSSAQMIETAERQHADNRVTYQRADLSEWAPDQPVDLLISNATFQWVPGHLQHVTALADRVGPGGVFAFGVPMNFDSPSHLILGELMDSEPFSPFLQEIARPSAPRAITYLSALSRPGWALDVWETTYLHVLHGADPVFEWISGTAARGALQALEGDLREEFVRTFKQRLREAYQPQAHGTILPFRRGFVVASRVE